MTATDVERRTFLSATAGSAAIATLTAHAAQAQPSGPPVAPRSTPMSYAMKPLPFDPQKIKGLSEKILVSHYENTTAARSSG